MNIKFKHKIGFVESEESRRYISTKPEIYVPEFFRASAANVKQGSDATPHPRNTEWMEVYREITEKALGCYLEAIEDGVCPEQARFLLPQGAIVNWVWTGSLMSYARFARLRLDDTAAQKEIAELAEQVDKIIAPLYPVSWAALSKY